MKASENILIAGGSGFLGRFLSSYLSKKGYTISLLGRKKNKLSNYTFYEWNPAHGKIDAEAFQNKDVIINLSGAGIADRFWTKKRKEIIYRSRIDSTALLVNTIINNAYSPSLFINASAIGYYGNRPLEIITETSAPGKGFISELCVDWENEITPLRDSGVPTAILRIGIVLGKYGGSLSKLTLPLRFGLNILFGKGAHMISWIHINDFVSMIEQLLLGKLRPEIYNAVSQNPLSQKAFNSEVLHILGKKAVMLKIPNFVIRLIVGDLASVITSDQNIQSKNLLEQEFSYSYPDIQGALTQLLGK